MSVVGETVLSARGEQWVITQGHAIAAMPGFAMRPQSHTSSTAVMPVREGLCSVTLDVKVPLERIALADVQSARSHRSSWMTSRRR